MAKKSDKNGTYEEEVSVEREMDTVKLSKLLIKELNKDEEKSGKVAWNLATDLDNPTDVKEWISTDSTLLDYCISNKRDGGIPVGKLTEISGEEASGKSLLCAHLAKNVQKKNGVVAYIDTENAMHPEFATQLGVDLSKMIYVQPGTIEEVGETIEKIVLMTRQKAKDKLVLIVWDSIAGTPPQAEIEGNFDPNERVGITAKALSKMMRKLTQVWGKERIAMVFTNQLRTSMSRYGDPYVTPGGKAVPYHASVRIRLTRKGTEKEGTDYEAGEAGEGDVIGVNTEAKVVKNRLGPPHRKCRFFISFAHGIEDQESWFDRLHEAKQIEKRAGWCYMDYKPEFKFREKGFVALLQEDPEFKQYILKKLEDTMIVKYGEAPADAEIDPESQMDVEQTVEDLIDPK